MREREIINSLIHSAFEYGETFDMDERDIFETLKEIGITFDDIAEYVHGVQNMSDVMIDTFSEEMHFYWNLYKNWSEIKNADDQLVDLTVGNCRVGDLCFDLVVRDYDGNMHLAYDLYVGGVDTGYGYGRNNYPYDYDDGGSWDMKWVSRCGFEKFRETAENDLREYILERGHLGRAKEELHIW